MNLSWLLIGIGGLLASASSPTATKRDDAASSVPFVTTSGNRFMLNGSDFSIVGANAYWLPTLPIEDINSTLANMSAAGINVVRTWGFNDVTSIPENGTWFQLITNETLMINNGTNGLQKLDTVVNLAQMHGMHVLVSLTNNWNPQAEDPTNVTQVDVVQNTTSPLPRNSLSNDYGGMDAYVRQLAEVKEHDQFYVNQSLIAAFQNYTTQVVSRYVNHPAILAWEVANDPRCNSTLPHSTDCVTTIVTQWHSIIAKHIKKVDPNHLVSSGNQGFFCVDCPKLFATTTASPQPSPAPGRRASKVFTREKLMSVRKAAWKRRSALLERSGKPSSGGIRIRGRWTSAETRRQSDPFGTGPAFNGADGVDSDDILNIPEIGFGGFQLLPDQNSYGPDDPTLPPFNNSLNLGLDWISAQATMAQTAGKPTIMTAFGLVTQQNAAAFVPVNSTSPAVNAAIPSEVQGFATDQQRDDAYSQWTAAAQQAGLPPVLYQWGQGNLTITPGSPVSASTTETGESPNQTGTGVSPNDGYSIQGIDQGAVQGILMGAAGDTIPS